MPTCFVCGCETEEFLLFNQVKYWRFCSADHLKEWLDGQEAIARFWLTGEKLINWEWEKEK